MDQRVRKVISIMSANLDRRLTNNDFATAVYLSPAHLGHLFKRETGKPVMRYLRGLRIERGRELLQTTFLTVQQIATRVGQSSNHFNANFKKAHGITPGRFAAVRRNAATADPKRKI